MRWCLQDQQLGRADAQHGAAMRGGFRTYGLLGAFLRRASDFVAFHDYQPFIEAGHQWAQQFGQEESCDHCRRQFASDELKTPW